MIRGAFLFGQLSASVQQLSRNGQLLYVYKLQTGDCGAEKLILNFGKAFDIPKWKKQSEAFYSTLLPMRRSDLGEFEEVVLLAVAVLSPKAYSVIIAEELEQETKQTVSTGAVHAALQRLEQKGYLSSQLGEATPERGGRRKRLFTVTALGGRVLSEVQSVRNRLWERIVPQTILKWS